MNFKLMKTVDSLIGWPLCVAFGLWVKFSLLFENKPLVPRYEKILIIKWFGIGTNIKITPLIRAVRNRYPKAKLVLLTFKSNQTLVELFNCYDEIRTIRSNNLIYFFIDTLKNLLRFGFRGPDIAIDLEFLSKFSTLFSFFSGAAVRIGIYSAQFWRRGIINFPVRWDRTKSLSELYRNIGKTMGIERINCNLEKLNPAHAKKREILGILQQHGYKLNEYLIGININASSVLLLRRWPLENFVTLVESLVERIDKKSYKLVMLGSGDEIDYNYSFYSKLSEAAQEKVINLVGKLDLAQFIALVDSLKFMITNDSGPLFIAALQGIPLISLWGPSSPYIDGDIALKDNHIFYLNLKCSPCFFKSRPGLDCGGKATCMKNIMVKDVLKCSLGLIKNSKDI